MSEFLYQRSALQIEHGQLDRLEHGLGYEGPGVARLQDVLDPVFHERLLEEINNPEIVHWRDAGETYKNNRGAKIVQNHDVFALKAAGDYEPIWAVPLMTQLAVETEQFIQSLQAQYASLCDWQADEMSYHRYYDAQVGLSYHRDNMRFPGLIVVIAIAGEADFQVVDREDLVFDEQGDIIDCTWHSTYTIPTRPGDMVLTRAPGLLPGIRPDDRPEHAVVNGRVLPRVSFMLRANSKPLDTGYGFDYYNFPMARSNE